jgi:hypothetical protein
MSATEFVVKYRRHILSVALVVLLAGQFVFVTARRNVELKNVDYFKAHQQERLATLRECHQKPINTLADTSEALSCRAAETAQQDLLFTHKDPREGKSYQFDFGAPEVGEKVEDNSNQVR